MSLTPDAFRRRCMEGRNEELHPTSRVGRYLTRRISPYITRVFLRLGISANQCTLLRILLVLGTGLLFVVPDVMYWIVGLLLLYGSIVLDCVDGELARYNGTSSPEGAYFDCLTTHVSLPYVLACMTLGLHAVLPGIHTIAFGLAAVVGASLTLVHLPLVRAVAYEWSSRCYSAVSPSGSLSSSLLQKGRRLADFLLVTPRG